MKFDKPNIKKTIKRRIELLKTNKKMGLRDKLRITEKPQKSISVDKLDRNSIRRGDNIIKSKQHISHEILNHGEYIKPDMVDYDVIIYIPSYDRYEKVLRILNALYKQPTDYTYLIILMNDGSSDVRYDLLKDNNEFKDLIILKNEINGGRDFYWRTTNLILKEIEKYKSYAVIQIDDDFILCDNFINLLMNKFFEIKHENNSYAGIRYHICTFNDNVDISDEYFDRSKTFQGFDGGSLFDYDFIKLMNFKIKDDIENPDNNYSYSDGHVWGTYNNFVRKMGLMVFTFRNSLVFHDGNDDSKMHPDLRKTKRIYTKRLINNAGNNI